MLFASRYWPAWVAGTATLSLAKILENMEIGHNVMHGQWDWMNDPEIHSSTWDWDSASTTEAWKHSHNYVHHTYTNIRGKDKDLGYEIMRIDPHQKWHPVYLVQPFYNLVLTALLRVGRRLPRPRLRGDPQGREVQGAGRAASSRGWPARRGRRSSRTTSPSRRSAGSRRLASSARWPPARVEASAPGGAASAALADALATPGARRSGDAAADFTANIVRNVWAYAIIFCGHFPDQTYTFSQEETEDETRGGCYVRQLLGAANIEGSPLFHVHQRQPRLPGRAPPLPGHAEHALRARSRRG